MGTGENGADAVDNLFLLVLEMFSSSLEGGTIDGFIAILLQGLEVGGKAAEHIHCLGVCFWVGGQLPGDIGVKETGGELGGGDLKTDFGQLAGVARTDVTRAS